ncbi:hypothetical protein AGMMS49975_24390 [Clostridia bacterium]|nr:hypothetical protein AGMMS49975_24390 [Clostridia bacterium]
MKEYNSSREYEVIVTEIFSGINKALNVALAENPLVTDDSFRTKYFDILRAETKNYLDAQESAFKKISE